jgi:CAAX prenyl protease-like protein
MKMVARSVWPFVLPFLIFSVFLTFEGWFPDQHYLIYPWKTLGVGAVIVWYWRRLPNLRPGFPILSSLVGIIAVVLWVKLDPVLVHYPLPLVGRNPFLLYPAGWAWFLFGFRLFGITVVVPITEELLWRGFLMRWLIKEDFTSVPLGTYTPFSFFVTTAFFASVHGAEWPLAVIVGLIYGAWFVKTKRLGDIMLAHGVTNFLLALYCLFSNDWHFLSIVAPRP